MGEIEGDLDGLQFKTSQSLSLLLVNLNDNVSGCTFSLFGGCDLFCFSDANFLANVQPHC